MAALRTPETHPMNSQGTSMVGRRAPNVEAVRLLLNAAAYLVLLCLLLLVGAALQLGAHQSFVEFGLVDNRDLVALFGWVGLTISGVSSIVVPSHVGQPVGRPYYPRLHLLLTNIGLVGYLGTTVAFPDSDVPLVFLSIAAVAFLLFGLALISALIPHVGPRRELAILPQIDAVERRP